MESTASSTQCNVPCAVGVHASSSAQLEVSNIEHSLSSLRGGSPFGSPVDGSSPRNSPPSRSSPTTSAPQAANAVLQLNRKIAHPRAVTVPTERINPPGPCRACTSSRARSLRLSRRFAHSRLGGPQHRPSATSSSARHPRNDLARCKAVRSAHRAHYLTSHSSRCHCTHSPRYNAASSGDSWANPARMPPPHRRSYLQHGHNTRLLGTHRLRRPSIGRRRLRVAHRLRSRHKVHRRRNPQGLGNRAPRSAYFGRHWALRQARHCMLP